MEKSELENTIKFVNKETSNKLTNNSSGSSLSLNVPSSGIGLESLNLIGIKNQKFMKPKITKFNIMKNNKNNDTEKPTKQPKPTKNPKIKFFQKIIFIPIISIYILISLIIWEKYFVPKENESEDKYSKYLAIILCALIYLCYFLSIFTPSYQTDINKKMKISDDLFKNKTIENILNKDFWDDYCINCQWQKFIRSSHCDICNKCILLKFTHCFFIANCIGFNNAQYIINFLFLSIYALFKFEKCCISYFQNSTNGVNTLIIIIFIINLPILLYLVYFFGKLLFDIYNNQTKSERSNNNKLIDKYYMFYKCNDTDNKFRFPNTWNIGYLSHFYYIIGPTILHFIFPLPKIKNYSINENCPIFKGCRQFSRLEFIQNMIKKNENYKNNIKDKYMEPDAYLEFCKQKNNISNN